MHRSFGMETKLNSNKWADIIKGPSLSEVRAHLRKIANYKLLLR